MLYSSADATGRSSRVEDEQGEEDEPAKAGQPRRGSCARKLAALRKSTSLFSADATASAFFLITPLEKKTQSAATKNTK
jgi:hypothetical protein